ncbi:HEPN domain-containing protein [Sulfitobacter sp. HNIBRBA2951]|uniref:HEPN domain-containing protein n=1 Tax=Sulfitobacter aquimarinus TaxID=3158557 RepID=UPI0032E01976
MDLVLTELDEVISARKALHGGGVGAPVRLSDGSHQGAALNKASVVLLSAVLQAFVEEVFWDCSRHLFGTFNPSQSKNYRESWSTWGNPNPKNITRLFRRIGVDDIFEGLSWRGQSTIQFKNNLNQINEVRNTIAHGAPIIIDGKPFNLTLSKIESWRALSITFGQKFPDHARRKIMRQSEILYGTQDSK